MMVIDTVHSSVETHMHAGPIVWMKLARPLHSLQVLEAARSIPNGPSTVENKGTTTDNLDPKPSTSVIRCRIMVPKLDEADDAGFEQLPLALSMSAFTAPTPSPDHSHAMKMDRATNHLDDIYDRSAASTPDQVCKTANFTVPMTKPLKKLRLFDLNKLPTSLPDSPVSSPTATIASDQSTTFSIADAVATSSAIVKCTDVEGDAHRGGANLAVDLGVLPAASSLGMTRLQNDEESSAVAAALQELPEGAIGPIVRIPVRRRLRKLSEYAGSHMSSASAAHAASMACKSWTTDDDEVRNHRDVTKTLASQKKKKVRGKHDVEFEVLQACSTLTIMSSSSQSFDWSVVSSKKRGREFASTSASSSMVEEQGPEAGPRLSPSTSSRSLGSGSLVLLRPSNKQRYRSMAELMTQTPVVYKRG